MLSGFVCPFRGLRFLFQHPRLLLYIAIPGIINAVLFSVVVWLVASRIGTWLTRFLPRGDAWYWTALFYLLVVIAGIALFLAVVYTFSIIGNLILGPFNDLLSEKVEQVYTDKDINDAWTLAAFFSDSIRSVKVEMGKLMLYLAGIAVLLLLNLLPLVGNAISGALMVLYTLLFLGWEYIDYSMERWRFSLRLKVQTTLRNARAFIGFGAGASLLLLIPIANMVAIPVCVTGATLLFCDIKTGRPFSGEEKLTT